MQRKMLNTLFKDTADDRRREGRSVIDDIEKRYVRGAGEAYIENDQEGLLFVYYCWCVSFLIFAYLHYTNRKNSNKTTELYAFGS